ncbi:MAG: cytochrome b/b6 domain-containing protein [bacterium]|nr:cytochrome b/b6 domain-containing protein [bacterium]MBK8127885.1 cytochrome b/b6 domain-containing protein [bacterium]
MKREYVYPAFERFWHWSQAALIILLGVTGFEIHGSLEFFGFAQAVSIHSSAAIAFLILICFAIFWHLTSGEWRQYVPSLLNVRAQVDYYVTGIFRGAPHPTRRTVLSKLNPLQKLVYAGLKVLVIPVMVLSGLIYMFYRYPQRHEIISLNIEGLSTVAALHTFGAFMLVAFFIAHIYLSTTGHSPTANLKAMVTGYEELPASADHTPEQETI